MLFAGGSEFKKMKVGGCSARKEGEIEREVKSCRRERKKESVVVQFEMLGKTKGSQPCGQDEHLRGNGGDGSRGQGGHK